MRLSLAPLLVLASLSAAAPSVADCPVRPMVPRPCGVRPPVTDAIRVEIVGDDDQTLPTYTLGARTYLLGSDGDRYRIRLVNPTAVRAEAVVSVDGLDVLDGTTANPSKPGYLVPAYGAITIDGWRTSLDAVAAFRFSPVRDSYAARTEGDRNVGIIGVALFPERPRPPPPPVRIAPSSSQGGGAGPAPHAAPSAPASRAAAGPTPLDDRAGLGTQFGEAHDSRVSQVAFERESSRPATTRALWYDDRDGLRAIGVRIPPDPPARDTEAYLRGTAQPFPGTHFALPPP